MSNLNGFFITILIIIDLQTFDEKYKIYKLLNSPDKNNHLLAFSMADISKDWLMSFILEAMQWERNYQTHQNYHSYWAWRRNKTGIRYECVQYTLRSEFKLHVCGIYFKVWFRSSYELTLNRCKYISKSHYIIHRKILQEPLTELALTIIDVIYPNNVKAIFNFNQLLEAINTQFVNPLLRYKQQLLDE